MTRPVAKRVGEGAGVMGNQSSFDYGPEIFFKCMDSLTDPCGESIETILPLLSYQEQITFSSPGSKVYEI